MLDSFSKLNDANKKRSIAYTEKLLSVQEMDDSLTLDAANDRGATAEQKKNADDIMHDDSEWE